MIHQLLLARHKFLEQRSIATITRSIGRLSAKWLRKSFFYRKSAVQRLTQRSGFTLKMSEALLDSLFVELTEKKLWKLLELELGDPWVLDGFRKDKRTGHQVTAKGPSLVVHIFAGNVPNPSIVSVVLGLLTKSANAAKLSTKDEGILDIFLESLRSEDAELADVCAILPPTKRKVLAEAMRSAGLVVAYGSDSTLGKIKKDIPPGTLFEGYGHRASFSLYSREMLSHRGLRSLLEKTAHDLWMVDQRGCLSPLALFLEKGGEVSPDHFARELSETLARVTRSEASSGPSAFMRHLKLRRFDMRAKIAGMQGDVSTLLADEKSGWTILYDESVRHLPLTGEPRTLIVKGLSHLGDALKMLLPYKDSLQAIALESPDKRRLKLAEDFSLLGFNRICRAGELQHPPITWHHDGRVNLGSWLHWTDLEN